MILFKKYSEVDLKRNVETKITGKSMRSITFSHEKSQLFTGRFMNGTINSFVKPEM